MSWFMFNASCFILVLYPSFLLVFANRQSSVHLAHECVSVESSPEAHECASVESSPVIMLHGLTDVKETWDGIYQNIPLLTQRRVCIYDARNHGDSEWNDAFNVDVLAEDLERFMADMKIQRASLVGHSMGGLTIMKFALKNPGKAESIFVEDISPQPIPKPIAEQLNKYLQISVDSLSAIPTDADEETAKKAVIEYFTNVTGNPLSPHLWKKFPLNRRDGVWKWKANFEVFAKALEDADSWLGKMEGIYEGRAFFIYGEDSPFKVIEDEEDIRKLFPNAEFLGVEGADHDIHPNNRVYFNTLIKFLSGKGTQPKAHESLC